MALSLKTQSGSLQDSTLHNCFSFVSNFASSSSFLTHRWLRKTASTSGGWNISTNPPTAACVRTCCSASASKDSTATVRARSCQQGAVKLLQVFLPACWCVRVFSVSSSLVCLLLLLLFFYLVGCAYTVHNQCANKNPEPCARTFVKTKEEIGVRNTNLTLFPLQPVWFYFCFPALFISEFQFYIKSQLQMCLRQYCCLTSCFVPNSVCKHLDHREHNSVLVSQCSPSVFFKCGLQLVQSALCSW